MIEKEASTLSQYIDIINEINNEYKKDQKSLYSKEIKELLQDLREKKEQISSKIQSFNGNNDLSLYRLKREEKIIIDDLYFYKKKIDKKNLETHSFVSENVNKKNDFFRETKFYYRGHCNPIFDLIPSIYRGTDLYKEDYYYHQIKIQCSTAFHNSNHLDQLVTMQHYDCPTRLLDITSNALVGLYFGCKHFDEAYSHSDFGIVYVFKQYEDEILYYDSDRALMISCLPKFSYNEKKEIYEECYAKLKANRIFNASNNGAIIEKLYHEIKTENPAFEKKMDPMDLLGNFIVQPIKNNDRILKQDGAFIINGLNRTPSDMKEKINDMVYAKIKIKNQDLILHELSLVGITEATLFPEVDHVAHFLKGK